MQLDVNFTDVQIAFDTVNHLILLLRKLASIGFSKNVVTFWNTYQSKGAYSEYPTSGVLGSHIAPDWFNASCLQITRRLLKWSLQRQVLLLFSRLLTFLQLSKISA